MDFTPKQISDMVAELATDILDDPNLSDLANNPRFNKIMFQLATRYYTEPFRMTKGKFEDSWIVDDNPWVKFEFADEITMYMRIKSYQLTDAQQQEVMSYSKADGKTDALAKELADYNFTLVSSLEGTNKRMVDEAFMYKHVLDYTDFDERKKRMGKLIDSLDANYNTKQDMKKRLEACQSNTDIEALAKSMYSWYEANKDKMNYESDYDNDTTNQKF